MKKGDREKQEAKVLVYKNTTFLWFMVSSVSE